jgi:hypothetical protein|tara:strand:+ start:423 stop:845 length:423 start_codon:yes stop_codon:yes gene_type:complete
MNLREQIEKEITDKVMTKLASEKVELNAIKEIEKQLSQSEQIFKKIQSQKKDFVELDTILKKADKQLFNLKKIYSDNRDNSQKFNKELNKNFDSLNKAAKDLGLDVTSIPAYKKYLESRDNFKKASDLNQSNWEIVSKYK